jgi:glutamate---cysteine ligase / carboxylate-amine ligase
VTAVPAWADWNAAATERPWTLGIEEEVMLLDPRSWGLVSRSDEVLAALAADVQANVCAETHGSALELATDPHAEVATAVAQLTHLRARLADALAPLGIRGAVAGTHPFARWEEVEVSPGARYQFLHASMRALAQREPTFGLHVHVAIPGPEYAVRAFNAMRAHLPLLLALSANSPFWQGRDTGLCSMRTPLFQAFPRVGIPRSFADYAEYVEAVDVLVRADAIPEPTFLWWDVRLQPRYGTLEVRIMDAQTRVADTAALSALVQCLVRLEALEGYADEALVLAPEVLEENRFIAARDGVDAALIDPVRGDRVPVRRQVGELLEACAPHAVELGCEAELAGVTRLLRSSGAARQRRAGNGTHGSGLRRVLGALHDDFVSARIVRTALAVG